MIKLYSLYTLQINWRKLLILSSISIFLLLLSKSNAFAGGLTLPLPGTPSINSWFDHTSPELNNDCCSTMTRYDGAVGKSYNGHNGIDFQAASGSNVLAAAAGTISTGYQSGGFGYWTRIWHSDLGYSTVYAHLSSRLIISGSVSRGSHIAESGCTGYCTGPHLHFGVYNSQTGGKEIDPYGWSGSGSDPWSYDKGWLWTTNPPSHTTAVNKFEDLATFYDYGSCNTRIHAFLSTGSSFSYQGSGGWWSSGGYCLSAVKQTIAGDFDGDGDSDIAVVYYYSNAETRVHVFKSNGTGFVYSGSSGWWGSAGGYNANMVKFAVAGKFNSDNKDDLALFYDYGGGETRIHVLLSTGTSFKYQGDVGWWGASGYSLSKVVGIAAGNFDEDTLNDIAVMYDYGDGATRIHVFTSNGRSFDYSGPGGWWSVPSGYSASKVKHLVAGKFNGADTRDDLAALYDYGGSETRIHVFLSNYDWDAGWNFAYQGSSGWWASGGYNLSLVPFALAGTYDNNGKSDIATIYDYPGSETRIHTFKSTGSAFSYSGSSGWWRVSSGYDTSKIKKAVSGSFDR